MTTTTAPPDPDEPTGPAAHHARRYGKPMPTTETPVGPKAWHDRLFPNRKATR